MHFLAADPWIHRVYMPSLFNSEDIHPRSQVKQLRAVRAWRIPHGNPWCHPTGPEEMDDLDSCTHHVEGFLDAKNTGFFTPPWEGLRRSSKNTSKNQSIWRVYGRLVAWSWWCSRHCRIPEKWAIPRPVEWRKNEPFWWAAWEWNQFSFDLKKTCTTPVN